MANDPELQQGPPPFMQAMMQGAPPSMQQAPPAPQASPMGPTSPFDLASTVRQVSQLPEYQQASGKLEQIGSQEQDVRKQMAGMPQPKRGWLDTQGQPQQGGFLHTLGRALMAIGAATEPGALIQEAQYGPGVARYNSQQKNLAAQLAALKDEEAIPTEELRATTGLTQAAGMAAYRGSQAETNRKKVDAYAQSISDRAKNFAATQDWRGATLDEKKRANLVNEAQKAADEAGRDYREKNRDATLEEVAGIVTGTRKEIANEAAARDPSVKSWLFNKLGIDVPQTSAPSPEFRPTPTADTAKSKSATPKLAGPPKGATHTGKGPDGKKHYADAQGNDLGVVP